MYWNWLKGGIALGLCFFLATAFVKPIGVSTQFVILDGMIATQIDKNLVTKSEDSTSGYASSNAYLNKSGGKYAKSIANPLNYSFIFVLCMFLGGLLGRFLQPNEERSNLAQIPHFHRERFADNSSLRYLLAFLGAAPLL